MSEFAPVFEDNATNFHEADLKTRLVRRESELAEAERIARLGFWRFHRGSGRVSLSTGARRLLGREDNASGLDLEGLLATVHPEDRDEARRALTEAMTGRRRVERTVRVCRPDGTAAYVWSSARPIFDETGRLAEIHGICQDVTAQVEAHAVLRESEDHYRHALELSPQIPWTADPDGNILEAGPRWAEVTGMPVEESLGTAWIAALHPDDMPPVVAAWTEALRTGRRLNVEYRVRQQDGRYRWMHASAGARNDETGRIMRWYGTLEDIDERKIAEAELRASEGFCRSILENTSDCIEVLDLDGRIRFMNGPGAQLIGRDRDDFVGLDWVELWPADYRELARDAIESAAAGHASRFTAPFPTRTGATKWWDIIVDCLHDGEGNPTGLLATSRDMTEALQARAEIDEAHARLAAVLESTTDFVIVIDREWTVTYMNQRTVELLGDHLQVGDALWEVYPEYVGSDIHRCYVDAMEGRAASVITEMFFEAHGIWTALHAYPTADGISLFFRDITEARRSRAEIEHLAHHDPLTGLANRTTFHARLAQALADPERSKVAILLLDLDEFKEVNDGLGHPVGDALLMKIADRFSSAVGEDCLLARVGGDEFAVLQTAPDGATAPEEIAERLIEAVRKPLSVDGNTLRVGVSIGVAVSDGEPQEAGELFKQADIALYEAKAESGSVHRSYEPGMHEGIKLRQALKQDLAAALENGEFEVVYQPLINLHTGAVCAYEALLRWHHPARGTVSPADFIPLAEETGLIVPLGEWVLEQACRQAMAWPEDVSVCVNLSPAQFRSGSLPMRIAEVLARTGLPASRLELEITESVLLQHSALNLFLLHAIKDLGARIALDDFGTGFSSLSYLRNFPFDKIKIDRAFVGDIGGENHSEAIMAAIFDMGRALAVTITAEGVETEEQLAWLKASGCCQAQGYLIGRPGPAAAIEVRQAV